MIKFDPRKTKKLSFGFQAENIDPRNLEYYIRLSDGKIDYGIRGEQRQNQLVFEIPPLNEFIEKNVDNLDTIKMEIHSKDNKYYLRPYEDNIEIEREPEIDVEVNESETQEEKSTFFVTEMKEEDDEEQQEEVTEEDVTEVEDLHKEDEVVESEEQTKKEKKRKNKKLFDYLNK